MSLNPSTDSSSETSSVSLMSLASFLMAVALGVLGALVVLPGWLPDLTGSLVGTDPKAFWYLSRGAAFVALGLLWVSMMLGLLITNKISRTWPGAPAAFAIHEYVSLLGMAFAIFHALILLGDHYINYKLSQILMPFGSVNYHPIWVGLGQIALYVWAVISISFYVRQRIGPKAWKVIHYASFFTFMIAVMHGLASGSDTSLSWAHTVYWIFGGSFLFLTIYRIITSLFPQRPAPKRSSPSRPSPAVTQGTEH